MKQGLVAFSRYRSSYLFIYTAKMVGISLLLLKAHKGFPGGSDGKESACNAGDLGLITGLGNPIEKGMAGEFHQQKSLSSYSP